MAAVLFVAISTIDQIFGLWRLACVDFDIGDNAFDNDEAASAAAALAALKILDGFKVDEFRFEFRLAAAAAICECRFERWLSDEFCEWCSSDAADCEIEGGRWFGCLWWWLWLWFDRPTNWLNWCCWWADDWFMESESDRLPRFELSSMSTISLESRGEIES